MRQLTRRSDRMPAGLTAVNKGEDRKQKRHGKKTHNGLLLPVRRWDTAMALLDIVPMSLDEVADEHDEG